jgi:hypothetical protein
MRRRDTAAPKGRPAALYGEFRWPGTRRVIQWHAVLLRENMTYCDEAFSNAKSEGSMKATVKVDAGICGFHATACITGDDEQQVIFDVHSRCEKVQNLGEMLKARGPIDAYGEISSVGDGVLMQTVRSMAKGCCAGCVVPKAINVARPEATILFGDCTPGKYFTGGGSAFSDPVPNVDYRHPNQSFGVVFCDSHAESRTRTTLRDWDASH